MPSSVLCAICEELMVDQVYFCPNNHNLLCAACCRNLKPCPECGSIVVVSDDTRRNYALEDLISTMTIEITKSDDACKRRDTRRPNSTTRAAANRFIDLPSCLLCAVCQQLMDGHIYFCYNKHSRLCSTCCEELRPCPDCDCIVIPTKDAARNFAMEEQIAQMKQNDPDLVGNSDPRKLPCDNEVAGCKLRFNPSDLAEHRNDCLFRMIRCPINFSIFTSCQWKGNNNKLADHMRSNHPENCRARVDSEAVLYRLNRDFILLQVIRLGVYNFLMRVKVDTSTRDIRWTVAMIGTEHAARTWIYEIHVYNKGEPHRKVTLTDICFSDAVPEQVAFSRCCQLPLSNAMSYLNTDQKLFYKVYIKKKYTRISCRDLK